MDGVHNVKKMTARETVFQDFEVCSLEETHRLASLLATLIPAGTCLAVTGTLGAGKTRFAQDFIAAHGIPQELITSPTFSLVHMFESEVKPGISARTLYHLDAYRLRDEDEFYELGIEEFIGQPATVTLIEWADRVPGALPAETLWINIDLVDRQHRVFRVGGLGSVWKAFIERLYKDFTTHRTSSSRKI